MDSIYRDNKLYVLGAIYSAPIIVTHLISHGTVNNLQDVPGVVHISHESHLWNMRIPLLRVVFQYGTQKEQCT